MCCYLLFGTASKIIGATRPACSRQAPRSAARCPARGTPIISYYIILYYIILYHTILLYYIIILSYYHMIMLYHVKVYDIIVQYMSPRSRSSASCASRRLQARPGARDRAATPSGAVRSTALCRMAPTRLQTFRTPGSGRPAGAARALPAGMSQAT